MTYLSRKSIRITSVKASVTFRHLVTLMMRWPQVELTISWPGMLFNISRLRILRAEFLFLNQNILNHLNVHRARIERLHKSKYGSHLFFVFWNIFWQARLTCQEWKKLHITGKKYNIKVSWPDIIFCQLVWYCYIARHPSTRSPDTTQRPQGIFTQI